MPHSFKVYDADPVGDVGRPIAVVARIQPTGLPNIKIEWYLFVLTNPTKLGHSLGNVINTTQEMAKHADPTGEALASAKNAFMAYQAVLQEHTGKPANPKEIEFAECDPVVLRSMWHLDAGHPQIVAMKDATICTPLKEFLVKVTGGPVHKKATQTPYAADPKPDPDLKST